MRVIKRRCGDSNIVNIYRTLLMSSMKHSLVTPWSMYVWKEKMKKGLVMIITGAKPTAKHSSEWRKMQQHQVAPIKPFCMERLHVRAPEFLQRVNLGVGHTAQLMLTNQKKPQLMFTKNTIWILASTWKIIIVHRSKEGKTSLSVVATNNAAPWPPCRIWLPMLYYHSTSYMASMSIEKIPMQSKQFKAKF